MKQTVFISGMTCGSCVKKITDHLISFEDISTVNIDLQSKKAELEVSSSLSQVELEKRLAPLEKYHILQNPPSDTTAPQSENDKENYWPLLLIALYIFGGALLLWQLRGGLDMLMKDMMTLYLLMFSFVQLIDLKGFAQMYRSYDPLTKKIPQWGYVYPPLNIVLAVLLQLGVHDPSVLGVIFVLNVENTIGVIQTLRSPLKVRCACMGAAISLPVGWITVIENLFMVGMSGVMLGQMFL